MTLPSFGRLPAATNSTSPRSFVTSRMAATRAVPSVSEAAASHFSVIRSLPTSPSITRRALATSGWRRTISATCLAVTNMARTLVLWSARPIQPLMRVLVRPQGLAPDSTAERSPVPKRTSG